MELKEQLIFVTLVLSLSSSVPVYSDEIDCKDPPSKLVLLRHGCRLSCGDEATPLSRRGREQAKELVERLRSHDITAVFVTKAVRSKETALDLAEHIGVIFSTDNTIEPTASAARDLVDVVCSGSYTSKAVLYVGHSHSLNGALLHLDPEFDYEAPPCGEGWFIDFTQAQPVIGRLPLSEVDCERSVRQCCMGSWKP